MPTERQKKVAEALIGNITAAQPLTRNQLLSEKVDYTTITALKKGDDIVTHPGVKQALEDYGFTAEGAKRVVANIMYSSETDLARLKATDQVFKVLGTYAAEKSLNVNANIEVNKQPDEIRKILEESEARLLAAISKKDD